MCTEKDEMGHRRKKEDFGGKYEKRKETNAAQTAAAGPAGLLCLFFLHFSMFRG